MPFVRVNGIVLHYRVTGRGPRMVLLGSLGSDFRIWNEVVEALATDFEILLYDKRGHGLSDTPPAPYTIGDHARDLTALLDRLEWDSAAFIGLSVGGLIAQEIAARAPERVSALILCDTAAKIGTAELWDARIGAVETGGIASIGEAIIGRWFTETFARTRADELAGWRNMLERTPAAGYAGTCAAIRDADLMAEARGIRAPTLCVVGDQDLSTPPDIVRATAELIPGARFEIIEGAGHLPCIEQPTALTRLISAHLKEAQNGR